MNSPKNGANNVAFRLQKSYLEVLAARARLKGQSHHLLAKEYVEDALHEKEERGVILDDLTALKLEMTELRDDLTYIAQILLASTGRLTDEQAVEWAKKNLQLRSHVVVNSTDQGRS